MTALTNLAPDEATVRRVLHDVDADTLDSAIGSWLLTRSVAAESLVVAVDGYSWATPATRPGRACAGLA